MIRAATFHIPITHILRERAGENMYRSNAGWIIAMVAGVEMIWNWPDRQTISDSVARVVSAVDPNSTVIREIPATVPLKARKHAPWQRLIIIQSSQKIFEMLEVAIEIPLGDCTLSGAIFSTFAGAWLSTNPAGPSNFPWRSFQMRRHEAIIPKAFSPNVKASGDGPANDF